MTGVQIRLVAGEYVLPLDPVRLAWESDFEVRHVARCLNLADDQIECLERAVALAREGRYGVSAGGGACMTLDPHALYRRANEILGTMPPDGRSVEDRINDSARLARQELSENGAGRPPPSSPLRTSLPSRSRARSRSSGTPGRSLIPEGGDVMIYGDGGASKTTLGIDLACHLAAGDDWLGIAVPRPVAC